MNTSIELKSIIAMLFAQESNTDNLKNLANTICLQVKEAYEARFAEIKGNSAKAEDNPENKAKAEPKSKGKAKAEDKKTSKAAPKTPEAPKTEPKSKAATDTDKVMETINLSEIKKLGLTFEKYSEWAWVLRGETKPLRKILKDQFKGVYNSHLSGGAGWVIKNDNAAEVSKAFNLNVKIA